MQSDFTLYILHSLPIHEIYWCALGLIFNLTKIMVAWYPRWQPFSINFGVFMFIQKSNVSGSCGSFIFSILRKLQTGFYRYYANVQSYSNEKSSFLLPISLAFILCFFDGSMSSVRWNLKGSFDLHSQMMTFIIFSWIFCIIVLFFFEIFKSLFHLWIWVLSILFFNFLSHCIFWIWILECMAGNGLSSVFPFCWLLLIPYLWRSNFVWCS